MPGKPQDKAKEPKKGFDWRIPSVFVLIAIISAGFFRSHSSSNIINMSNEKTSISQVNDSEEFCLRIPGNPSSMDFFNKYVSKGVPFIITGVMESNVDWGLAMKTWNNEYLRKQFGDINVKVSMSPNGAFEYIEDTALWPNNGKFWHEWLDIDSKIKLGKEVFSQGEPSSYKPCSRNQHSCLRFTLDKTLVRPARTKTTLSKFFDTVEASKNISYYVQYEDIPQELESQLSPPVWANFLPHEMTGLWIGLGPTKANLHYDANENLMFMITGSKKWTLFEPEQSEYLYEGFCKEGKLKYVEEKSESPHIERDDNGNEDVSYFSSPVDLSNPDYTRFPLLKKAKAKVCTLRKGEILYLPAFWWHEVESSPDSEGRSIGVNYWYAPYRTKPIPCPTCPMAVNRKAFPKDPM